MSTKFFNVNSRVLEIYNDEIIKTQTLEMKNVLCLSEIDIYSGETRFNISGIPPILTNKKLSKIINKRLDRIRNLLKKNIDDLQSYNKVIVSNKYKAIKHSDFEKNKIIISKTKIKNK